jgi:pimeloyl-ACP methyl ester carboxylesterase
MTGSSPALQLLMDEEDSGENGRGSLLAEPQIAAGLAERLDVAVLTFDYSGFGTSEGPRCRLDPQREVRDVRAAISWMCATFPAAADCVGLYGTSFGGAISTVAAATDDRVKALVSVSPFASGKRWMRDLRPHWQWLEFVEGIEADRLERVKPGATSRRVDPDWIMPRDPEAAAYNAMLLREFPERRSELDVVSGELIVDFEPIEYSDRLRDTPTLYMHCVRDLLIPVSHAEELARRAGAQLVTFNGIGHYDVYDGQPLIDVLDLAAGWFDEHLNTKVGSESGWSGNRICW